MKRALLIATIAAALLALAAIGWLVRVAQRPTGDEVGFATP